MDTLTCATKPLGAAGEAVMLPAPMVGRPDHEHRDWQPKSDQFPGDALVEQKNFDGGA